MKNLSIRAEFFTQFLDKNSSIKFFITSENKNWEIIRTWDHFCFFLYELKNSVSPHPKSSNGSTWSDESLLFHITTTSLPPIEQLNFFLSSLIEDRLDDLSNLNIFINFFENTDKTIANILDKLKALTMMEQSITSLDNRLTNLNSTNQGIFMLVNQLYNSHNEELCRKEKKRLKKKLKKNDKINDSSSSSSSSYEEIQKSHKRNSKSNLKYGINLPSSVSHHLNYNSETDNKRDGVSSLSQSSVSEKEHLAIDVNLTTQSFDLTSPKNEEIPKIKALSMLMKRDSINSYKNIDTEMEVNIEQISLTSNSPSPPLNSIDKQIENSISNDNNKKRINSNGDEENQDNNQEYLSPHYLSRVKPNFSPEWKELIDITVNTFIESFQPSKIEIANYNRVLKYLRRLARTSLGTTIYEAGLHALGCNLPGDIMRFTVIINHNQSSSWVTTLFEKLKRIMLLQQQFVGKNEGITSNSDENSQFLINDLYINNDVTHGGFKLILTLDGQPIEIVANARNDLIMLAFFSEFATKVDNNNLFHRSVLLVKLWWNSQLKNLFVGPNDTFALSHNKLITFFSEITLVFLLVSVMNTNNITASNSTIFTSPLQNLFFFIQRLACFDNMKYCLTLQGYTKFDNNSNSPRPIVPNKHHKCNKKMINDFINISFPFEDLIYSVNDESEASSQIKANLGSINTSNTSMNPNTNSYYTNVLPINLISSTSLKSTFHSSESMELSSLASLPLPFLSLNSNINPTNSSSFLSSPSSLTILNNDLLHFERYDFNVLNPFNKTNMIHENLSKAHRHLLKHFFLHSSSKIFEVIEMLNNKNFIGLIDIKKDILRKEIIEKLQGYLISLADPIATPIDLPKDVPYISLNPATPLPLTVLSMRSNLVNLHSRFNLVKSNLNRCYKLFTKIDLGYFEAAKLASESSILFSNTYSQIRKEYLIESKQSFPVINKNDIWKSIHFSNFLLAFCINESSLFTFCVDMLVFKGPLPVGEIGKLLTEGCNIPQVTTKVRDNFNGLKKFLESFNGLFLFSSDHPFNPHVILRCSLTEEQLSSLDYSNPNPSANGAQTIPTVPVQWLSKLTPNVSVKKTPKSSNVSSTSSTASSIHDDEASINLRAFHRSVEKTLIKFKHEENGEVQRSNFTFPLPNASTNINSSISKINNSTLSIKNENVKKTCTISDNNSDSELSELSNLSDMKAPTTSSIFCTNIISTDDFKNSPYLTQNNSKYSYYSSPSSSSNSSTESHQSKIKSSNPNMQSLAQMTLLAESFSECSSQIHNHSILESQHSGNSKIVHNSASTNSINQFNRNTNFDKNNNNPYFTGPSNLISANGFNPQANSFNPTNTSYNNFNYNGQINECNNFSNHSFISNPPINTQSVNNQSFGYQHQYMFPTSGPPNSNVRNNLVSSNNINNQNNYSTSSNYNFVNYPSNYPINQSSNPSISSFNNNNNNNNFSSYLFQENSSNPQVNRVQSTMNYSFPTAYPPNSKESMSNYSLSHYKNVSNDNDILNDSNSSKIIESVLNIAQDNI